MIVKHSLKRSILSRKSSGSYHNCLGLAVCSGNLAFSFSKNSSQFVAQSSVLLILQAVHVLTYFLKSAEIRSQHNLLPQLKNNTHTYSQISFSNYVNCFKKIRCVYFRLLKHYHKWDEMKEKRPVKACTGVKLQSKGKAAEVYVYSCLAFVWHGCFLSLSASDWRILLAWWGQVWYWVDFSLQRSILEFTDLLGQYLL